MTRTTTSPETDPEAAPDGGAVPLLSVSELSIDATTVEGRLRLVDDVSFDLAPGELLGIAGESGSGKTLTALSVMGLLPTSWPRPGGSIRFAGDELLGKPERAMRAIRGAEIGMVFQEPMSTLHPDWTIGTQIVETIRAHERIPKADARDRAIELLDLVGIGEPQRRVREHPHELSGGMQQRVVIAMALACRPKLVIADEPTTALDVTVQAQIVELFQSIHEELGTAIAFVSHDLGLLAGFCERIMVMYSGQVIEDGPVDQLFTSPRHPYTEALFKATIDPGQKGQRLPTIPGFPPHAEHLPPGCRFEPRCPYARDTCSDAMPELVTVGAAARVRCSRHDVLTLEGRS